MQSLRAGDVVVANGFNRFHLAAAAAALEKTGHLRSFLTGAYPFLWLKQLFGCAGISHARLRKFYDRGEAIPEERIHAHFFAETVYFARFPLRRWPRCRGLAAWLDRVSFRICGWQSAASLRRTAGEARIFHFRSGFGLSAARAARDRGMLLICDHSIVHPRLADYLVENSGLPPPGALPEDVAPFWRSILEDIDAADFVLVNSEFVRNTFIRASYPADRIAVVYLGVDESFFQSIPPRPAPAGAGPGPLRLLFAGMFESRKGAELLLEAMRTDSGGQWEFAIAGTIAEEYRARVDELLERRQVAWHGALRRAELARVMAAADVLVFPSLAEGSARVIFEAMACGCAILTTPNAGSIVREGENGWLVPPGDPVAFRAALAEVCAGRSRLAEMGERNARLVREEYREADYGRKLRETYAGLLAARSLADMPAL